MSERDAVARVRAWAAGRPLPQYSTIHAPIVPDRDALILAFVRMGGESSPWGLALGRPGQAATIHTVPEARNRDAVAQMITSAAPTLLRHFGHPDYSKETSSEPRLRQLWLPNGSHLAMLHALAYSYIRTKFGDEARVLTLNAVGRLAEWLFRESQRPGQVTVMTGTDVLRSAFVFPADPVREAHLGFLLAWLRTKGARPARMRAAEQAEQHSISTTLDPAVERDTLEPLLKAWREATKAENLALANARSREIATVLDGELRTRFALVESAITELRNDARPVNAGVATLTKASLEALTYEYLRSERNEGGPKFVPSPETDYAPAAAAAAYFKSEAADEARISALIQYDDKLQQEAIATGDAIRGKIIAVRDDGPGRKTIAFWTIEAPEPGALRIREGSRLSVARHPGRDVIVRKLQRGNVRKLLLEVEITSGIRPKLDGQRTVMLGCVDPSLRGEEVTLVPSDTGGLTFKKLERVWMKDAPGAWLTHSATRRKRAPAGKS